MAPLQENEQRWVAPSQPVLLLAGQLPEPVQPHWPPKVSALQTSPARPAAFSTAHATQAAPLSPQAASSCPAAHWPESQQPPLHGWVALQTMVHVCIIASQAERSGHWAALWQPQVPPTQSCPRLTIEQSAQAPPVLPHAVGEPPATQVLPRQQPPLQGVFASQ
jgi:hypothetical protein